MLNSMFAATAAVVVMAPTPAAPPSPIVAARTPEAIIDTFFKGLQAGKTADATYKLFPPIMVQKKAGELDGMVSQVDTYLRWYGQIDGWDLVSESSLTPYFMRRVYVLKAENGPMFWTFYMYRSSGGWNTQSFTMNDTASTMFD